MGLLFDYIREHFWEFVRFGISGSFAAFAGVAMLFLLTDVLGIWYVAGSIASFVATFVIVFILQKFWTFRETSKERIPTQSLQNLILSIFNLVLNTVLIFLLVDVGGLNHLVAQTGIYGLIGAIDFFVYKYWIFRAE